MLSSLSAPVCRPAVHAADLNADVASGYISACPQTLLGCPLQPIVMASAFASSRFTKIDAATGADAYLGGPSVRNEHTVLPGWTQDSTVQNMAAYSFHSCASSPVISAPGASWKKYGHQRGDVWCVSVFC